MVRIAQAVPKDVQDAEAIARVCSGDHRAMAILYDRYSRTVYSVALRVLSDPSDAEDILQDVFTDLWRNPDLFDANRGDLAPWLAVISRHRAIDHLRKRRPETNAHEMIFASDTDLETATQRDEAVRKVRGVLASMPDEQRVTIEMAFFDGLTHSEISGKTGQPLGTVKTRIRAGLLAIRKAFRS